MIGLLFSRQERTACHNFFYPSFSPHIGLVAENFCVLKFSLNFLETFHRATLNIFRRGGCLKSELAKVEAGQTLSRPIKKITAGAGSSPVGFGL